jgi:hypothetical protein
MRVDGLRVPKTGHDLPTDTLGRYADTTVSPPVFKAACHITVHCARASGVQSTHSAVRAWVMMACCRRAEACAATVCAEATARRVSAAPSPVRGF